MKNIKLLIVIAAGLLMTNCGPSSKIKKSNAVNATYETTVLKAGIPSPKKEMNGKLGATSINVIYGSPSVKGRTVWGELVPYGQVWRTGANEATTFETSQDIMVEGQKLAAGKYGFFTIPNANEWTIIFNKTSNQWGAYDYKAADDVLRVNVKPKTSASANETLEYTMRGNQLIINWEKLEVPITIK